MRYYKLDANGNKLFAPIIITPEQAKRSGVINNILLPDGTTTSVALVDQELLYDFFATLPQEVLSILSQPSNSDNHK